MSTSSTDEVQAGVCVHVCMCIGKGGYSIEGGVCTCVSKGGYTRCKAESLWRAGCTRKQEWH